MKIPEKWRDSMWFISVLGRVALHARDLERELATERTARDCWQIENESRAAWIKTMNEIVGYNNDDGFHCTPSPHDLAKRWVERAEAAEARISELESENQNHAEHILIEQGLRQAAEAQAGDVAKLREVLEWMDRKGGLGLDVHERIRAALASVPAEKSKA